MIITNTQLDNDVLIGRLGNKLFVIASILGAAKSYGNDKRPTFPHWKYEHVFKHKLFYYDSEPAIDYIYTEPHFHFAPIDVRRRGNVNLAGYFQSWKYFDHIYDDIKYYFEPSDDILSYIKEKYNNLLSINNTVSIHVRRGDYIKLCDHHPPITVKYILDAMNQFATNSIFVFFSDDIEWCKSKFGKISVRQIEFVNDEPHVDMFLMSMMKSNIIANSSLSWWAAYLNKNEYKKVIYPDPWFGKGYSHNMNDLCPENWKKISCS